MNKDRAEKILSIIDGGVPTDPEATHREELAIEEEVWHFCVERYEERGFTRQQAEEAATRDYLDWRNHYHLDPEPPEAA